jgi:hypothetical protein
MKRGIDHSPRGENRMYQTRIHAGFFISGSRLIDLA